MKELKLVYNNKLNEYCYSCKEERIIINSSYICMLCGDTIDCIINDNYIDPQNIIKKYPYKQVDHFKYKLMKLQGNDNQKIPDEIINKLKLEKYSSIYELHYIMKRYGYKDYFQNIILIDYLINGRLIHNIDSELFNTLIYEFTQVQEAFYSIKGGPKQMINYNYLIFKLCNIYSRQDVSKNIFFICKYNNTIKKYDSIWYKICRKLNYPYFNTSEELANN